MRNGHVSVLICTHNRRRAIGRCLDSLAMQDYDRSLMDICVLDDGSSDGTPAAVEAAFGGMRTSGGIRRLFRREENLQIAAGRSFLEGMVSADSEFICYVDDDAELPPGALSSMAAFMKANPDAGASGPRIAALSSPAVTAHRANFVSWLGRYSEKDSAGPLDCDWLNSTCLMVRASALSSAGGFYPGFYTAHEEVDLCLRLKKNGWRVVYLPGITVLHDIVPGQAKRDRLYYLYRNKFMVFRRNFAPLRMAAAFFTALFFGLPKYVFEAVLSGGGIGEIRLILTSIAHGLSGREGRL